MTPKPSHIARSGLATAVLTLALASAASAQEPDPEALVNALNGVFGNHKMRASHAKGYCVTGNFTPSPDAPSYSKAVLFSEPSTVIGRFSLGGGNPKASDAVQGGRGLALRFSGGEGDIADFVMLSVPVFFARTPQQVLGFLEARYPAADGKPDPEKVKAFAEANPETSRQGEWLASHDTPASYASTNYWAIHAYTLTNADDTSITAKFKFIPKDGVVGLTKEEASAKSPDFYKDELKERFAKGPVEFDFVAIIGKEGDPIDDPTALWPEDEREAVTLGTLEIANYEDESTCDATIFAPSNLPDGIGAPENDQIFPLRTPAYAVSFSRRAE